MALGRAHLPPTTVFQCLKSSKPPQSHIYHSCRPQSEQPKGLSEINGNTPSNFLIYIPIYQLIVEGIQHIRIILQKCLAWSATLMYTAVQNTPAYK